VRSTALRAVADIDDLPGQVPNPYAYFSKAAVFVLSSAYEGLPNVLIEALACGCPVVSTDCPSGPAEILSDGEFGCLVPVGDIEGLATAIEATLEAPPPRSRLVERARAYSLKGSVAGYEAALTAIVQAGRPQRQDLPLSADPDPLRPQ
jgi:glycosyltransferase involved in cell wall biosynthesis